jgi:hypothetical protein
MHNQLICVQAQHACKVMQQLAVQCENCAPSIPAQTQQQKRWSLLLARHTVLEQFALQVTMAYVALTGQCVTLSYVRLHMFSSKVPTPLAAKVCCAKVVMRPLAANFGHLVNLDTCPTSNVAPVPQVLWSRMNYVLVPHAV